MDATRLRGTLQLDLADGEHIGTLQPDGARWRARHFPSQTGLPPHSTAASSARSPGTTPGAWTNTTTSSPPTPAGTAADTAWLCGEGPDVLDLRTAHGRLDAETCLGHAVLEILQARAEASIVRQRGVGAAAALLRNPDGHETLLAVVST